MNQPCEYGLPASRAKDTVRSNNQRVGREAYHLRREFGDSRLGSVSPLPAQVPLSNATTTTLLQYKVGLALSAQHHNARKRQEQPTPSGKIDATNPAPK